MMIEQNTFSDATVEDTYGDKKLSQAFPNSQPQNTNNAKANVTWWRTQTSSGCQWLESGLLFSVGHESFRHKRSPRTVEQSKRDTPLMHIIAASSNNWNQTEMVIALMGDSLLGSWTRFDPPDGWPGPDTLSFITYKTQGSYSSYRLHRPKDPLEGGHYPPQSVCAGLFVEMFSPTTLFFALTFFVNSLVMAAAPTSNAAQASKYYAYRQENRFTCGMGLQQRREWYANCLI